MGAAISKRLSQDGYHIAILSSSGKGEALGKALGGVGLTGSNLVESDLRRFVDLTLDQWGRTDAVVNSAGHGPKGAVLEISDDDWQRGMEVYFLNVVRLCRLVTPRFLQQGQGSIVNISTYATFEPESTFPTSGAFAPR